jgi:hypothetical protein
MIGLVHLVWTPLGVEPLRQFLRSYHAHPAGIEHELVVVLNGPTRDASGGETHDALLVELASTEHRLIVTERPVLDLAAYGFAARRLEHERLCFLNSYSVVLADGWLGHLARALEQPGVGLVGATASWESQAEWVRNRRRYWLYQLALLRGARRDFPRFPNPHLRSTGFMAERRLLVEMDLERAQDKHSAYLLESGRDGITRQVQERGLRSVVVGRDGRPYETADWPGSSTFRSGEQANLLVADNRTRDWQRAPVRLRRRLTRDAWGADGEI